MLCSSHQNPFNIPSTSLQHPFIPLNQVKTHSQPIFITLQNMPFNHSKPSQISQVSKPIENPCHPMINISPMFHPKIIQSSGSLDPKWIPSGSQAGKWMFIPLKMVLIGIDPYPSVMFSGVSSKANNARSRPGVAATRCSGTGAASCAARRRSAAAAPLASEPPTHSWRLSLKSWGFTGGDIPIL